MFVTENELDQWVRAHARDAQGLVVELVWRLVAATVPQPRERRFPLGDSIGQHGPDGRLTTDVGFEPWVPEGPSLWEVGTNLDAGAKATKDYRDLVAAEPEAERLNCTFVFVTPLSGTRGWEHTWKPKSQAQWLRKRQSRGDWKDVRVIDGTKLIDWVSHFPAVGLWLAERIAGIRAPQVESPTQRWELTRSIGEPPPLVTRLFLANRDEARERIAAVFAGDAQQAKLDTLYPDQVIDFVCAYLAELPPEQQAEAAGRCVIVSGLEAWMGLANFRQRQVLVADAGLDLSGGSGTTLIQRARRNGHGVIFGGMPGGVPDPMSAPLRSPTVDQVEEALRSAGYAEHRAKSLAQRSGGNLGSLLRCVQNLSLMPSWSEDSAAAELAIATVLGAWTDTREADRAAVERLAGNAYGEWIGRVREAARRPGTPLAHQEGRWRFVPRFEGWYSLGPRLFDEHLVRLGEVALAVLGEHDPQFELDKEHRFAAGAYGKKLAHSRRLRRGLADALALLGSHPRALTSCSLGKAETTAAHTVRTLLADADWTQWAALDDVLPLLAEAAPTAFLDSVDQMLRANPGALDALFAQEGSDAVTGRSYVTGLLWALETLAWDAAYFGRTVATLGDMAARDPGGRWVNRPRNSLRQILLPWLPQTCAPAAQRGPAVATLLRDQPAVGWQLVLALLPVRAGGVSTPTRRPSWRPSIPDDWTRGVTSAAYWAQVEIYAQLAVDVAKRDADRLAELIGRWDALPQRMREDLYSHIESESTTLPADPRQRVWAALVELVTEHRRFGDAEWALEAAWVDRLEILGERLTPSAPSARYRRLFSEHGVRLYEERGNYEEQARRLERRRQAAVVEVMAEGGVGAVVAFAETVDAPWRVGVSLGHIGISPQTFPPSGATETESAVHDRPEPAGTADGVAAPSAVDAPLGGDPDPAVDTTVLPALLTPVRKEQAQLAGGFIRGRFHRYGWAWVDALDTRSWTPSELGQFFAFLPFVPESWDRAERLLQSDAADYWTCVAVNPYETDTGLDRAVEALLRHGRPQAAADCLARQVHDHQAPEPEVIVRTLISVLSAQSGNAVVQSNDLVALINTLQNDPRTSENDLFNVEWAYLPLLDGHHGGRPKHLNARLAKDPAFFCELIRLVFRPRGATQPTHNGPDAHASGTERSPDEAGEPAVDGAGPADEAADANRGAIADRSSVPDTTIAPAVVENAYRLLREWQLPPGVQLEGEFDGAALEAWMHAMRREAAATGHLEIALNMAGQVLMYVPPDPDGLWIHRAAAVELDGRDADDLRRGFQIQIVNSRGVHWVDPSGKPEDELARLNAARASDAEAAGYPRLAATMREIASSYEREAERVRAEHRAEA